MQINTITTDFAVAGQVFPDDLASIAKAGFKTIICNRPDGEGMDQADYELVSAEAEKLGLKTHYIPIIAGMMTMDDVTSFNAAMEEAQTPVLAYCRSGARSGSLHSIWLREKAAGRF